MTVKEIGFEDKDAGRLFPIIDRLFALFFILEIVAFTLVPFLPLAVAAAALTTRVRLSRWRMVTLWVFASILTLMAVSPFVLGLFHSNFVENGPVHTVISG